MSAPAPPDDRSSTSGNTRTHWLLRPAIMLPLVLLLIVILALLTPEAATGRRGDVRLTTRSTQPLGAAVLYDLAARLGWHTSRRLTPMPSPTDTTSIQAVLDPLDAPSAIEAHALLESVRRGDALLLVYSDNGALADSLHLRQGGGFSYRARLGADFVAAGVCPAHASPGLPLWLAGQRPLIDAVRFTQPPPRDTIVFADVQPPSRPTEAAAVGFPYGRGRIVAVADPDLLRNDVLRVCAWNADIVSVHMLEYLAAGAAMPRIRLVFDEYHQGFGLHPGTVRGITMYLGGTPSGHVLFQLAGAGVILLLAVGPRALPPRREMRVERRSPLEHVDALAHAYARVGATRTATARLLAGARRRLRWKLRERFDESPAEFLAAVGRVRPALQPELAVIQHALDTPVTRREFEQVGAALGRMEHTLATTSQ